MTTFAFGYKEVTGKRRNFNSNESIDLINGKFTARRYFHGPWSSRFDFIYDELLIPWSDASGQMVFAIPNIYPDYGAAVANRVQIRGSGEPSNAGNDNQVSWDNALITVDYENFPFQIGQGNPQEGTPIFIEESIDAHKVFKTIPAEDVVKVADDEPVHDKFDDVTYVEIVATIILKETYRINPNWGVIGNVIGKVNSSTFTTPSGFSCGAETLLYIGPSGFTKIDVFSGRGTFNDQPTPIPVWELTHKFEYNRRGWNVEAVDNGEFVAIKKRGGSKLYDTGNLAAIFFS